MMYNHNYIGNDAWSNSAREVYNLKQTKIVTGNSIIDLFNNKKAFSTAPYASYGGVYIQSESDIPYLVYKLKKLSNLYDPVFILLKTNIDCFKDYTDIFQIDLSYNTFVLNLMDGAEKIWRNKLKDNTRSQTRKGLKQKLDIKVGHLELLDDYYKVISRCWRDLGTPTHSKDFHKAIIEGYGDSAYIILLYLNNQPASTALLLFGKNTIRNPFAGTIRKYNNLSINNVLYWKIIEFACNNGFSYWDMGRSPIGSGAEKYKLSWGAEQKQLYYYYLVRKKCNIPDNNSKYMKFAIQAWKFVPLPIANILGHKFIRNIL